MIQLEAGVYEDLWEEVTERRRPEFDAACVTYAYSGDESDLQALHEHLQASTSKKWQDEAQQHLSVHDSSILTAC
jgi:hypothetical protein